MPQWLSSPACLKASLVSPERTIQEHQDRSLWYSKIYLSTHNHTCGCGTWETTFWMAHWNSVGTDSMWAWLSQGVLQESHDSSSNSAFVQTYVLPDRNGDCVELETNVFIKLESSLFCCFPLLFILYSHFHNVRHALFLLVCYACRVDRHLQTLQFHLIFALSADADWVPARPSLSLSFPHSLFSSPPPPHDSPYLLAISLSPSLSLCRPFSPLFRRFFDQCSRVDSCHSGNFARLGSH